MLSTLFWVGIVLFVLGIILILLGALGVISLATGVIVGVFFAVAGGLTASTQYYIHSPYAARYQFQPKGPTPNPKLYMG